MHHRIERLPAATRVRLVAVVNGCEEEQPLPKRDDLEVRWVHRPHPDADASDALVEAVRALGLPDGEGFAWVAGEASQVRAVYRHLVRERGLPTSHIHTSGHWKRGVVAHDHHQPIRMEDE
jgi:NADPH-dependent ferric siderophore reductase